jgi:hypothetical protein
VNNYATEQQRKYYFALVKACGLDSIKYKEKAKEEFKLDSFTHISSVQLSTLIDKLKAYAKKKEIKLDNIEEPDPTDEWGEPEPPKAGDEKAWKEPVGAEEAKAEYRHADNEPIDKATDKDARGIKQLFKPCIHDWKEIGNDETKLYSSCTICGAALIEPMRVRSQ